MSTTHERVSRVLDEQNTERPERAVAVRRIDTTIEKGDGRTISFRIAPFGERAVSADGLGLAGSSATASSSSGDKTATTRRSESTKPPTATRRSPWSRRVCSAAHRSSRTGSSRSGRPPASSSE
jgi:hypothetical protein